MAPQPHLRVRHPSEVVVDPGPIRAGRRAPCEGRPMEQRRDLELVRSVWLSCTDEYPDPSRQCDPSGRSEHAHPEVGRDPRSHVDERARYRTRDSSYFRGWRPGTSQGQPVTLMISRSTTTSSPTTLKFSRCQIFRPPPHRGLGHSTLSGGTHSCQQPVLINTGHVRSRDESYRRLTARGIR